MKTLERRKRGWHLASMAAGGRKWSATMRSALAACARGGGRARVNDLICVILLIIWLLASQGRDCHAEQTVLQPQQQQQQQETPSQLFMAAAAVERQVGAPIKSVRHSKQAEEEGGFVMKMAAQSADQPGGHEGTGTEATTLQQTELETTTLPANDRATNGPAACEEADEGRIAINATRQQFVTHDQLLKASTRDEQPQAPGEMSRTGSSDAPNSRAAMPRLSFLSGKWDGHHRAERALRAAGCSCC